MGPAVATAVFALSYLLLAFPRTRALPIGRPAAALLGAVLMVATRSIDPRRAYEAIDGNTLVLLVALMALSSFLERAGLFARLAQLAVASRLTPQQLLTALVFVAGGLSAVLLNDTVCLFLTPVVCEVCLRRALPLAPYLLALATSSNLGSAATLVGNPQNILIGTLGPLSFLDYLRVVGPAALVALAANAWLLKLAYGPTLGRTRELRPQSVERAELAVTPLLVAALVVLGYAAGLHLAFTTLTGVALLIVLSRREPSAMFAGIDWSLIVFFAALFVVVGAFADTGLPARAWELARPHLDLRAASGITWLSGYTLLGSNLFSNVPLVMLTGPLLSQLGEPVRGFALLGYVSTVAGNLTLLGSVANLIVAERAREHHDLTFMAYLRFGVVSTVVSLLVGVPIVCLLT